MALVRTPLAPFEPDDSSPSARTVRAMELGQHGMALLLTAVGVMRAVQTGTPVGWALAAGFTLLAWHAAGGFLPSGDAGRAPLTWWLVSFALVWVATVALSPEFVWLAFLLWLLAGHLFSLGAALTFSACILVVTIGAPLAHDGTISLASIVGPLVGGTFALGISRGYLQLLHDAEERERLVRTLTEAQREMASLQDELAQAQRESGAIAERTRISRDLHDTVAQSLSSVKLIAHAAGDPLNETSGTAKALGQIEALASESLADVRRIVAALSPAELEQGALPSALRRMLDRLAEEADLATQLAIDGSLPALPPETEIALLRTAQSALANVRQHAQASHVVVSLIDASDTVRLDIIDDGRGFDHDLWAARDQEPHGSAASFGLRFMRTRLRELGGGLEIESMPGEGTALSAFLPMHRFTPKEVS
ncbi:sensor histidine kinase [Leucobacter sp. UCMA 4100]|uniref:sensor histidine kinase n=1 Tax=Leucobacter sp. UCMA 4100 TaxID=2810534 RepID=UPI0022EA18B9|nr:sensor histidine kinase [Leucobacter sp. UCMA 4100]MDA3147965.1 sensor histidine kinase [Leucobacter sp. UCMA 4100]